MHIFYHIFGGSNSREIAPRIASSQICVSSFTVLSLARQCLRFLHMWLAHFLRQTLKMTRSDVSRHALHVPRLHLQNEGLPGKLLGSLRRRHCRGDCRTGLNKPQQILLSDCPDSQSVSQSGLTSLGNGGPIWFDNSTGGGGWFYGRIISNSGVD